MALLTNYSGEIMEEVSESDMECSHDGYTNCHSFLRHDFAMRNSQADLADAARDSTKVLLFTYTKPTFRLTISNWKRPVR